MDFSVPIDVAPYQTINLTTQPPSQCNLTNTVSQISCFGIFLLLFTIGYFCLGCSQRKQSKQQASNDYRQQIERLERIWKLTTHQEP